MGYRKRSKRKVLSVLMAFAMVIGTLTGIIPGTGVVAKADEVEMVDNVSYLYYASNEDAIAGKTTEGTHKCVRVNSKSYVLDGSVNDGWYVVDQAQTHIPYRVTINGDVKLILGDNTKFEPGGGITVTEGNSLTIYSQSTGDNMGFLYVKPGSSLDRSGIGGEKNQAMGTLNIHGGKFEIHGGEKGAGIGTGDFADSTYSQMEAARGKGLLNIYGGDVKVRGGSFGAGIGGGYYMKGFPVNIYGGNVYAFCYMHDNGKRNEGFGAGIGGGMYASGGDVNIYGGDVYARADNEGAGIGGGSDGNGGKINISGGNVTAISRYLGAGIGGGYCGTFESVTITGGNVVATSEDGGSGIGNGYLKKTGDGIIRISGGNVTATGEKGGAGIGAGEEGRGCRVEISGGTIKAKGGSHAAGIGGGAIGKSESELAG